MEERAQYFAELIVNFIKDKKTDEEITEYFIENYRKGYVIEIYPVSAMSLNVSIMIKLIRKEFDLI